MNLRKKLRLASDTRATAEELEELSGDEDCDVRCCVALNTSAPSFVLERLSKDKKMEVRYCVARNTSAPIFVLERLGEDEHNYVRCSVALNPSVPSFVLEKLSRDRDSWIRYKVAENPNTRSSTIDFLSDDKDLWVLWEVARHSGTSVKVLEKLLGHKNRIVRKYALQNINNYRVKEMVKVGIESILDIKDIGVGNLEIRQLRDWEVVLQDDAYGIREMMNRKSKADNLNRGWLQNWLVKLFGIGRKI